MSILEAIATHGHEIRAALEVIATLSAIIAAIAAIRADRRTA